MEHVKEAGNLLLRTKRIIHVFTPTSAQKVEKRVIPIKVSAMTTERGYKSFSGSQSEPVSQERRAVETPREYLVEVLVTLPRGESLDDWGYVGKFFADYGEHPDLDLLKISGRIAQEVAKFERKEQEIARNTTSIRIPVLYAD